MCVCVCGLQMYVMMCVRVYVYVYSRCIHTTAYQSPGLLRMGDWHAVDGRVERLAREHVLVGVDKKLVVQRKQSEGAGMCRHHTHTHTKPTGFSETHTPVGSCGGVFTFFENCKLN